MSLTLIFSIIVIHWVADFVLQTHWQASNKSKNNYALLMHVSTYTVTWLFAFGFWLVYGNQTMDIINGQIGIEVFWFFPITFVLHFITDYITSRINSILWKRGDIHNFFVSIGFDQVLHYVQLFLTINWILS